jgi:hypothetical protein
MCKEFYNDRKRKKLKKNNNNNNNNVCAYIALNIIISKRFTLLPQQVYAAQPFNRRSFYHTPFCVPGT